MTLPAVPRESATVLLLRDGPTSLEVFMVRRHLSSDFVGGAYVFPGGGLDEDDCDLGLLSRCHGVTLHEAAQYLGLEAERALGHWAAAIRETFEEAGVLLAKRGNTLVAMAAHSDRSHWDERRAHLLDRELAWGDMLVAEDLLMACDHLHYFAHWITPEGVGKRFTTRFFLAVAPADQTPLADDREVEAGVWIAPADALARHAAGTMTMIFPTVKTLQDLAAFADTRAALAACVDRRVIAILPRVLTADGVSRIVLPGEAEYDTAAATVPPSFDPTKTSR